MAACKLISIILFTLITPLTFASEGKHLFILAGQSNMLQFNPKTTFIPLISAEYGKKNIIVVKDAYNAKPIRRWYKGWRSIQGEYSNKPSNLYDNLLEKVQSQIKNQQIQTVTFIWMQGEQDAYEQHGHVYRVSLKGLIKQLETDLNRENINVIIGRLSDFDLLDQRYKHWTMIREAQLQVVKYRPNSAWVNTDDLNDGINSKGKLISNDLHYSVKGYNNLGTRYAKKAIDLIYQNKHHKIKELD